ncbi:MAG: molybdate transport system substrate-binding protein [Frankiales bacterium]|nr:molybdate transport system substrate-binding protein [Frankiales bacterium]
MRRLSLLVIGLALLAATACTDSPDSKQTLTVLAASSLSGVLEPLGTELARSHRGLKVRVSYAGSPALVAQVRGGAPADVIVTASPKSLAPLVTAGLVGSPRTIASNTAVLVVPPSNPGSVRGLADLAQHRLRIALCDPSVPCGSVAQQTLTAAHVTADPDTLAPDVKTVLRLVETGEADAGIVYRSDLVGAGARVREVPLPDGAAASTSYPAAVVTASKRKDLASEYVDLLLGQSGRTALTRAGFALP